MLLFLVELFPYMSLFCAALWSDSESIEHWVGQRSEFMAVVCLYNVVLHAVLNQTEANVKPLHSVNVCFPEVSFFCVCVCVCVYGGVVVY